MVDKQLVKSLTMGNVALCQIITKKLRQLLESRSSHFFILALTGLMKTSDQAKFLGGEFFCVKK